MKWTLKEVIQETEHKFLNYYTLVYDVEKEDGRHRYEYYMTSRRSKEELLPVIRKYDRPDGVMIPLYYIDEKGELYFLLTTQFRPALGRHVTSVPAGLMEKTDEDILEVARREAAEEAGAEITDLEIIARTGSTASGFSDETNGIVLARIQKFKDRNLEEFEDIRTNLYTASQVRDMLKDDHYFFALEVRTLLLYLMLRFERK